MNEGFDVRDAISLVCRRVEEMLLDKNDHYGNSAIDPIRIMSKADPIEQIKVRIDDKLSRLSRGSDDEDEDVELDLIGYFVLLRVARLAHYCEEAEIAVSECAVVGSCGCDGAVGDCGGEAGVIFIEL